MWKGNVYNLLAYAYGAQKTSGENDGRAGSFLEIRTVPRLLSTSDSIGYSRIFEFLIVHRSEGTSYVYVTFRPLLLGYIRK